MRDGLTVANALEGLLREFDLLAHRRAHDLLRGAVGFRGDATVRDGVLGREGAVAPEELLVEVRRDDAVGGRHDLLGALGHRVREPRADADDVQRAVVVGIVLGHLTAPPRR